MPKQIRRRVIAADRLINECRDEIEHLLPRRLWTDEVIDAVHLQGFCRLGKDVVLPISQETVEHNAHIGPAEVQCEIVTALLSCRQSKIGRQHPQGGVRGAHEPEPHILPKICRHFTQFLCVNRKGIDNRIILCTVKRHCHFPPCAAGSSCTTSIVWERRTSTRVMRMPSTSST